MQSKTQPILARAIEITPDALVLILEGKSVSISWEHCSERLAHASPTERNRAVLSPSGCGIHWPLIDEDLAVGPLLQASTHPRQASGMPTPTLYKDLGARRSCGHSRKIL